LALANILLKQATAFKLQDELLLSLICLNGKAKSSGQQDGAQ
jgi:hypothetical protein